MTKKTLVVVPIVVIAVAAFITALILVIGAGLNSDGVNNDSRPTDSVIKNDSSNSRQSSTQYVGDDGFDGADDILWD